MPHLRVEYSSNLDAVANIPGLVAALHAVLAGAGPFELGGIRVRAFRADSFAVADLHPDNAFVDMTLRIGAGRTEDERRRVGEALMAAARGHLAGPLATPHFALSLEVQEIGALSWKANSIHARLRG